MHRMFEIQPCLVQTTINGLNKGPLEVTPKKYIDQESP